MKTLRKVNETEEYTDYRGDLLAVPGFVLELVLTTSKYGAKPYLSVVVGTEESVADTEPLTSEITQDQADAILAAHYEA